ncbi:MULTISPECIES: cobalt transporter CbiM [Cyanophyceae]|uniref:cobalt transporter CbiM n=1 Tax=Cyanophyceae TaxID=3028117 RepID=UPI001686DC39|nr:MULTISPECIES: cobalt transporter CbiM [unclassified Phormidium]MBD1917024.1 cobalt transporter CbiM [Phormidium sp. FACHB-77]MBD2029875.1 cobalt transporter CbiM [Phormidium sp. FACHB-322]MBD2050337.1 cobalt transporter CbiM [Leptolyngbya sp. FACHB-60]
MHIPDGILPAQVCAAGYAMTGVATWYSLRQINRKPDPAAEIPKASLLTAAFFVASSIYIPVPPASVHLILNGLLGVVLGYFAFPAILIGLFFQALVIGHGGITTLGVNAVMMGIPALAAYHIFQLRNSLGKPLTEPTRTGVFAFLGGALGLGIAALIFLALIIFNIPAELNAGAEQAAVLTLSVGHVPLAIIEGMFTTMLVLFLRRVKPELLEG